MKNLYVSHNFGIGVNLGTSIFANYTDITDGDNSLTYAKEWHDDIIALVNESKILDLVLVKPNPINLEWLTSTLLSKRIDVSILFNLSRSDYEKYLSIPCKKFIFEITDSKNINLIENITNVDCILLPDTNKLDYNLKLYKILRNIFQFNIFMECNEEIRKGLIDKKIYDIIPVIIKSE